MSGREAASEVGADAEAIEREPGRDPSKLDVPLAASMRADTGLKRIHLALLGIVVAHEPGVREDLDPEFLHDFRVAVRRTRVLLGQVKHVFPKKQVKKFRAGFAWLGGVTGPCRDFDVFLLQLEDLEPQSALIGLREFLAGLKSGEHVKLARALSSARYRRLLGDWRSFLEAPPAEKDAPAHASRPLLEVIEKRAWKLRKKILRLRHADSPGDVHRLRLACKKLRYVLDCTRSLYAPEAYEAAVRPLKKLQDLLGDYNDAEVQTQRLTELAEPLAGSAPPATLMAMDGLIESRRADAKALRQRMTSRIEAFCDPGDSKHFERMFASARESP
jgi:CHAD domain-containing protein